MLSGAKVDPESAERSLLALRELERTYKRARGEFVACGPVPKQVPRSEPVKWPRGHCFDLLRFRPGPEVRFQWQAQLIDGKLVLIARADPDGDGIPQVWFVGDEGVVRGAGLGTAAAVPVDEAPPSATEEEQEPTPVEPPAPEESGTEPSVPAKDEGIDIRLEEDDGE